MCNLNQNIVVAKLSNSSSFDNLALLRALEDSELNHACFYIKSLWVLFWFREESVRRNEKVVAEMKICR